jgi:hypothetical protein
MSDRISYHHFNNAVCLETCTLLYIEWNGIGIADRRLVLFEEKGS